jgi:iron complex transport system ATP-binding protein
VVNAPQTAKAAEGLSVNNLGVAYGRRVVLDAMSIAPLPRGSVTSIVGPNGAGKSTFLRAIAGLVKANGTIALGNVDLQTLPAQKRAERIGFMPQSVPPRVGLSVLEATIGAFKATDSVDLTLRAEAVAVATLEGLGILPLALEAFDTLSGGQKQLASLAQAIVRRPEILLLDEPTSALDLHHQLQVVTAVRRVASSGTIVLMTLHDLTFAARWSDRIAVLGGGRVYKDGVPAQVLTSETLAKVYGVSARIEPCSQGFLQVITDADL